MKERPGSSARGIGSLAGGWVTSACLVFLPATWLSGAAAFFRPVRARSTGPRSTERDLRTQRSCSTERTFPEGSLNQAT